MIKSKNVFIKVVSYIVISLLSLLIILTFGMPSFLERMGMNKSVVAVVNGEPVSIYDFMHFMYTDRRFSGRTNEINNDDNMRNYVLSVFIKRVLSVQFAEKLGIKVSKNQVLSYIKDIPYFLDEDKKFSSDALDRYLKHFNMSFDQFFLRTKDMLLISELNNLIVHGTGAAPGEVLLDKQIEASAVVLNYAFLPLDTIKERYAGELTVDDKEIDERIAELKDDTADRDKVKKELEQEKLAAVKSRISEDLTKLAQKGESFEKGIFTIDITPEQTKPFKLGEPVYAENDKKTMLYDLYSATVFNEDCLLTEPGKLARAINGPSGVYIYTPVSIEIPEKGSASELSLMEKNYLVNNAFNANYDAILSPFLDNSSVQKKFESQKQ